MKIKILFPSDYFNNKVVDEGYEAEYKEAVKFTEYDILLYNYDQWISGEKLRIYPNTFDGGVGIYRGWMLNEQKYQILYQTCFDQGVHLINSPKEYVNCHEFPSVYKSLGSLTPNCFIYKEGIPIEWDVVKKQFSRFMLKDFVKSVKGTDFPMFFDSTYSNQSLEQYTQCFKQMRGSLYTGGIVIKQYVELAREKGITNEYRAFYLYHQLLSLAQNSNQQTRRKSVPEQLLSAVSALNSNFYTVDFAELKNGEWVVIETGDGQVSGLSPNQYIFKFYNDILNYMNCLS